VPGEAHSPTAWQITVHAPEFDVPDWLKGAVIYQIFPDRFRRDLAFTPERFEDPLRPERIHHDDWSEDVDIAGKPETGYIACDFFGGSLKGISEKIDYIASLGVTVIYLNPIFASRSNHRYDTGDYEKIDPILGSIEDFQSLCAVALQRGIRIILDGVFSHTGADSRYFNKYGRFPGVGAYQEAIGQGQSPYGSWYVFHRKGSQLYYDSWWGFQDLPSVNEHELEYRSYLAGPNGIVRRWLRLGASGWRLDVSDELPDSFLRDLRSSIKTEKPDAALRGELWEDASNKISYGSYHDFLLGNTHDHLMGYPFQQALMGWLAGHFPAERLFAILETLHDHYPAP
jgi:4-alpha-glucanotransferase